MREFTRNRLTIFWGEQVCEEIQIFGTLCACDTPCFHVLTGCAQQPNRMRGQHLSAFAVVSRKQKHEKAAGMVKLQWSEHDSAVQHVRNKRHEIVYRFQFKNLEIEKGKQMWMMRDLKTGEEKKIQVDDPFSNAKIRSSNKLIWADTLVELTKAEIPSGYDLALQMVEDGVHDLVYRYQFKKLEFDVDANVQWWMQRDLTTGEEKRIADADPLHSYRLTNHFIWADTRIRPTQAEMSTFGDDDKDGQQMPSSAPTVSKAAAAAKSPEGDKGGRKKINRIMNLGQKQAILNEVVFGTHKNRQGDKIAPFRRNDHGNNGHFFNSVIAALNSQQDGAFTKAPATVDTVRNFVENAVEARKKCLEKKFGVDYMTRKDWNLYDYATEDEGEAAAESKMQCSIDEMLDALVYNAFDPSEKASVAPAKKGESVYLDADDEELAITADGGAPKKRPREHQLEKVRERSRSAVTQLGSSQNGIAEAMKSINALLTTPLPVLAPSVPALATPAVPNFDEELLPLLEALKGLPVPPGTTAVCMKLVVALGEYGFTSLQQLQQMQYDDAVAILVELKWTPLQIQRVLGSKPVKA